MARIRTIKPDFWTDETLTECSLSARLLFIGTWNFADDRGNLENSHKQLKMKIFPADNVDCKPLLQELITHGLLTEYSVSGNSYLNIKGFIKHQVINRPSKSNIPDIQFNDNSVSTHGVFSDGSLTEGKGMDSGMEGIAPAASVSPSAQPVGNNKSVEVLKSKPLKTVDNSTGYEVFEHWQTVMNHSKAVFNDKAKTLIKNRFAEGFTVDSLKTAISGCAKSPHHMGENDSKTVYDSLELILRNGENVNRFMGLDASLKPYKPKIDGLSAAGNKTANAISDWAKSKINTETPQELPEKEVEGIILGDDEVF